MIIDFIARIAIFAITFLVIMSPILVPMVRRKRIAAHKPDYDKIRALELNLFGKVYEKGGELHPERLFIPESDKPKEIAVDITGHYYLKGAKMCNLNAQLGPPCPYNGEHKRNRNDWNNTGCNHAGSAPCHYHGRHIEQPEVWTSNKHIIIDRGDTYTIIEGEGLE